MLVWRFAAGMYAVQSIRPGCTGSDLSKLGRCRAIHPSLPDDRAMRSSLLRLLVRIDRCTGGVFRWRYHDPRRHVSELGKIVALDVRNWACSMRDWAHSPFAPNFISPATVLKAVARI